jgi:hypothetical protein
MAYGYNGRTTEHSGPKKGKGAWDRKAYAKKASSKARRFEDRRAVQI